MQGTKAGGWTWIEPGPGTWGRVAPRSSHLTSREHADVAVPVRDTFFSPPGGRPPLGGMPRKRRGRETSKCTPRNTWIWQTGSLKWPIAHGRSNHQPPQADPSRSSTRSEQNCSYLNGPVRGAAGPTEEGGARDASWHRRGAGATLSSFPGHFVPRRGPRIHNPPTECGSTCQ